MFRYQSTVKNEFMVLFICFLQILLMQQSHGQTQDLVDVTGQAAGIFTQAHISALSSCLEYKNNKFSTFLLSGI